MFGNALRKLLGLVDHNQEQKPQLPMAQPAQTVQPNQLQVQQGQGTQPSMYRYEDDYTPSAALENTGYYNPQTTQYGYLQQNAPQFPTQITRNAQGLQANGTDQFDNIRKLLRY